MKIDHVVFAVRDLDAAAAKIWERCGLAAQPTADHGGAGTANRIIPVGGDQFVELLAISDPSSAHPIVKFLATHLANGDRLLQLAIDPGDIDAAAARLCQPVIDLVRSHHGHDTRFRLTGIAGAFGPQLLPFFVTCSAGREWRLGYEPARHRVRAAGIRWVELGSEQASVNEQLGGASLPLRFVPGRPGVSAVALDLDGNEVVLRA
jgi:hypothetical protein